MGKKVGFYHVSGLTCLLYVLLGFLFKMSPPAGLCSELHAVDSFAF